MANENIVSGLFGLTPRQVELQQQANIDANALAFARMSPLERANLLGYQAGAGLGQIGGGLFGIENRPMVEAERTQAALQGADTTTPEGLMAVAARFNQLGMPRQAMMATLGARQMKAEQSKQALEAAQEARAYAEAEKALREPVNMTDAIKEFNFAKSQGYTGTFQEWIAEKAKFTGKGESVTPIAYIDPTTGKAVWGTIGEARGKTAAQYSPETKGAIAGATAKEKELGEATGKAEVSLPGIKDSLDNLKLAGETIKKHPGLEGATGVQAYIPSYPGSQASMAEGLISEYKDAIKLAGLNLVRQGGGIGAMTEKEWPIVEGMVANLDAKKGKNFIKYQIDKVNAKMEQIYRNAQNISGNVQGKQSLPEKAGKPPLSSFSR